MFWTLKLIIQNKKALFLIIGVVLVLAFFPSHVVLALDPIAKCGVDPFCYFGLIANLVVNLPLFGIALLAIILLYFGAFLAASAYDVAVSLTNWLIHSSVNIGVVPNPATATTPAVVGAGWEFTLGFVNMLFILILVFYGLTTILRIKEYDIRKTLPKVLAIAILVNFTPVIVGLIVDAGNITTNFFISNVNIDSHGLIEQIWDDGDTAANTPYTVKERFDDFIKDFDFAAKFEAVLANFIGMVTPLAVAIIFFIVSALIFLMVGLIFLMRIIMLWVLMILAPIAFFSYVIPEKAPLTILFPDILLWRTWWREFLKWVVVGIPFGLFIYISNEIMKAAPTITGLFEPATNYAPSYKFLGIDFGDVFTALAGSVAYALAIAVLYVGYTISKKAAPDAARGIISGVTKLAKTAGAMALTGGAAFAGATVGGAMAGTAAAGVKGVSSGLQKAEEKLGERRLTKPFKYALKPLTGVARGAERVLVPRLRKAEAEMKKEKIPEGLKDMKGEAQKDVQMSRLTAGNRLAVAAQIKTPDLAKFAATDERFRGKLAADVKNKAGDKDYSEYIDKIKKAIPDIVDEKILINLEPDEVKKDKLKTAIDKEVEEMDKTVDKKDIMIEAGLKYKVITQNDIDTKGEAEALAEVQKKLNEGDITRFKRDAAAGAIGVGKAGPAAVGEYSDTTLKSFAVRWGSQKWHGGHLAKVREKHDKDTIKDFFEKPGGINTIGIDKLEEDNSRLAQHLVVHPTGREWDYKGRKEMMEMEDGKYRIEDRYGRIRPNYEKYKAEREKKKEGWGSSEIRAEIARHEKEVKILEDREKEFQQREAIFPREEGKKLRKLKKTTIPNLEIELEKVLKKEKKEEVPEEMRKPVPVITPEELTTGEMATGKKALKEWRDLKKEEREIISDIEEKIKEIGAHNEKMESLKKELASLEEEITKVSSGKEKEAIRRNINIKRDELVDEEGKVKSTTETMMNRRNNLGETRKRIIGLQSQEAQARLEKSKILTPEAQITLEREGVTGEELEKRRKELVVEDIDLARRLAKPEKGAPKWVKEGRKKANRYISDIEKDRKPLQKLSTEIEEIDEKLKPLAEKTVLTEKETKEKEKLTTDKNKKVSERDIVFEKIKQRKEGLKGIREDIKTWMEKKDVFLAPLIDEDDRRRKASERGVDYDTANEKTRQTIERELTEEVKELIAPLKIKRKDLSPEMVGPAEKRKGFISSVNKDLVSLNRAEKEIESLDKKIKFRKTALKTEKFSIPEERRREWEREKRRTTGLNKLEGKLKATQNKRQKIRERIKSSKEELIKIGETISERRIRAEPEPGWDGPKPDWVKFDEKKELDPLIYKISEERRDQGDIEFKPMQDREEAIKRLTKELVKKPSSLPKIRKVRGRIPKELREDKTKGDKLISDVNRRIKTLQELNKRINKNQNQLTLLEEQLEKATGIKKRRLEKNWGKRQKMLNDRIKQARAVQKEITDKKKELEDVRKDIETGVIGEEVGRKA